MPLNTGTLSRGSAGPEADMALQDEGDSQGWSVVRRDGGAEEWRTVALHAFWLRSPAALDAQRPAEPEDMEELAASFRRHGQELNVLEHDLTECLNEFKQAYQVLYQEPSAIALKKFSNVYDIDNLLVRIHKFRETVPTSVRASVPA